MKGKDRKEKKEKQMPCQVCFSNYYEGETFEKLVCTSCDIAVHRYCYSPDTKNKFKCDQCKQPPKSKDTNPHCSVCGINKEKGILKNVGNEDWMHVLCAFSSTRAQLISYKTLTFLTTTTQPLRKSGTKNRCRDCNFQKIAGSVCSIQDCGNYLHLTCLVNLLRNVDQLDGYEPFLTIGLLDKHQNSLYCQIKSNHDFIDRFKGLDILNYEKSQIRYFVCSQHNSEQYFKWCLCGKEGKGNQKECERCKRWLHPQCDNFDKICGGCSKNDIYLKNAKLPELVEKAIQAQSSPQLDKLNIKYLDHHCLKLSKELFGIVGKYEFQVQRYYLRKALQNSEKPPQQNGQNSQASKLQILYFMVKKQAKSEKDITTQDIEEMISSLFSKNSKFQVKDKLERVQKNSKNYLQAQLAIRKKDGTQDIKLKLNELIQKNKQAGRKEVDIAEDICELVKMFKNSDGWKAIESEIESSQKNLLKLFYELNLSVQETTSILQAIKLISVARQKKFITENQYHKISQTINLPSLDAKKKNMLFSTFNNLLQGLRLRKVYKEKGFIQKDLELRERQRKNKEDIQNINRKIAENNIMVTLKTLKEVELAQYEAEILKLKINKVQHDSLQQSQKDLKKSFQQLLKLDNEYHLLSKEERKEYEEINRRRHFYSEIREHHKRILMTQGLQPRQMEVEQHPQNQLIAQEHQGMDQSHKKESSSRNKVRTIEQQTSNILRQLNFQNEHSLHLILQQLYNLANFKVTFDPKFSKSIDQLASKVITAFNERLSFTAFTPSAGLLQRLNRIAIYFNKQDQAQQIIELYSSYFQWKQQLQNKFPDIPAALENHKSCSDLLKLIQSRIEETIEGVDIKKEVGKLKAIKMWALLSQKLNSRHKATITSIQQTKSLMDKLCYPQNELRRKVQALDIESRDLNKKIGCVLQKPKPAQHQIYEEIALITAKMTLEEGFELRNRMEISQLDVQIELEALIEEINEFQCFPKQAQLRKYIMSQRAENIDNLIALKRKIFENAFRFKDIEGYQLLVIRIIEIKCEGFRETTPNTKKDYFMHLRFGRENGAKLYQRTISRQKAYRQVQKAEKEHFSSKNKFELLLPPDCKRLLQDLKDDPHQSSKVARWFTTSQKLKEQFRSIRKQRLQLNLLAGIQSQLLRIPINNRQTLNQISKIRRQIEELSAKVKHILNGDSTVVLESPYTEDLINKYLLIGVRSQYLERFHQIFMKNRIIMDYGRNIRIENYAQFSKICNEYPELIHNGSVFRVREEVFYKIADAYLQSNDPWMEIGYTLLGEGGSLLSQPIKTADIIRKITEINYKFYKWQSEVPIAMPIQRQEEDSQEHQFGEEEGISESQEVSEEDEDADQLIDSIGDDSQMDDQSSDSEQPSNGKRPRPFAEVVNLDDD